MASENSLNRARDEFGRYIKITTNTPSFKEKPSSKSEYPNLIDVHVTDPFTYLKVWMDRFFKNSEMSFSVKIKPMALISVAIAIAIVLGGTGFSIFYLIFGK